MNDARSCSASSHQRPHPSASAMLPLSGHCDFFTGSATESAALSHLSLCRYTGLHSNGTKPAMPACSAVSSAHSLSFRAYYSSVIMGGGSHIVKKCRDTVTFQFSGKHFFRKPAQQNKSSHPFSNPLCTSFYNGKQALDISESSFVFL